MLLLFIATENIKTKMDTRIHIGTRKKEVIIVEVRITAFENLRTLEEEKKHKYALLANQNKSHRENKNKIIDYVMTLR